MSTKVLLISPYGMNYYGGVQHQLKILKKELKNTGLDVKILSPDSKDFNIGKPMSIPFNGSKASTNLLPNRLVVKEALQWADILHVHEPFIPIFFWRIPINKNTIITHHADLSKFFTFLQNKLIHKERNAFAVTAVSKVASTGLPNDLTLKIIPNTIKVKKSNLNNMNNFSFLFIGRDEKRKNFKLFKKLATRMDSFQYNFTAITNHNKKSPGITIYDNPDENLKKSIFSQCNIYLAVNTHGESFGITLIEAITEGCLVVCSDIKAFKDVLGPTGIYFENNSIDSLLDTVEKLKVLDLNNEHQKQLQYVQKYNTTKVITAWISLYSQI
tara:strand:+ start:656 stop:1639 length:984 start_codon:yes stop_codon:yes gene_type:complete